MPTISYPFDQGSNTAKDESELSSGELKISTGVYYKPGDNRIHKIGGRSTFDDISGATLIKGVALCQFDSGGTDQLIAYAGTSIYNATPGATGTFGSALISGLDSSATEFSVAHYSDKWYIVNGYDYPRCLKSDATVRRAGMIAPQLKPTCAAATGAVTKRPVEELGTGSFTGAGNAYDASGDATYANASATSASTKTATWGTFSTNNDAGRVLYVVYGLAGMPMIDTDSGGYSDDDFGVGGTTDAGFNVDISITLSTDGGTTFPTTLLSRTSVKNAISKSTIQLPLSVGVNNDTLAIKATMIYNSGTSQASFRIYDIRTETGGSGANFDTTSGMYYAYTEYDANEGLESPPSEVSELVTFTAKNAVNITLSSGALNTNATHFRIYRTPDGGTPPNQLGLIGSIDVTQTTFRDDFTFSASVQTRPIIPLKRVTIDSGDQYYTRDNPMPVLDHLTSYKGSLVGVKGRSIYYSEAGRPESWPEINVITAIPLPEHDTLVASVVAGDTLIVAATGAMLTLNDLPRVVQGVFNAAEVRAIQGQPGCVGRKAITTFSVAGEPRVAWVSKFGIHVTNGVISEKISTRMDWYATVSEAYLSSAVLHWDHKRQVLIFAYDSDGGGTNDRFILFHMSSEHSLNGVPKWSGPHYGSINSLTSGEVSGIYRVYSGHVSDGKVYLENSGTTDSSQSYSSTQVPAIVTTGKIYADYTIYGIIRANLRHTDAGTSETINISVTSGYDNPSSTDTSSQDISINSHGGTEFFIGRSGEWHQFTFTHTGSADFALRDIRFDIRPMGKAGTVLTV